MDRSFSYLAIATWLLCVCSAFAAPNRGVVKLDSRKESGKTVFTLAGLPGSFLQDLAQEDDFSCDWFQVRVDSKVDDLPAVTGAYHVAGQKVVFTPRFPVSPGVTYHATFSPRLLADRVRRSLGTTTELKRRFVMQATLREEKTVVTKVYPTRNTLPENLLKFYLHFSAPMSRGQAYQHIHLVDDAGKSVELPFLELDQELWDSRQKRLTLLLDPGRIKRGLRPREEVGPALIVGRRYRLVVDKAWKDAAGNRLANSFSKTFDVGNADTVSPSIASWKFVRLPRAGERNALKIQFRESLDSALLRRVLTVVDSHRVKKTGRVNLSADETMWSFTPDCPWVEGTYKLQVETILEDLVGNSLERRFEEPVGARLKARPKVVQRTFQVKRKPNR